MSEGLFYYFDLFRLAVSVFAAISAVRFGLGYSGRSVAGFVGTYLLGALSLAIAFGLGIDAVRNIVEVLL